MSHSRVLIIDNDEKRRQELDIILRFLEYKPISIAHQDRLKEQLQNPSRYEAVLMVLDDQQKDLATALGEVRSYTEDTPIIAVVNKDSEVDLSREVSAGSVATVKLPVRQTELQTALQRMRIYREGRQFGDRPRSVELFRNLVGSSQAVRRVRRMIEQVAATDATVLLTGESGTGKEVVARNIHFQSDRRHKPFVPVNCGAIHAELLESELFGHEKGAFTGAITARRGRFEMAEGGTLFLDEIGDMPPAMQVKLLRVIQERIFERVGSEKSIHMQVRIITATHIDLDEAIDNGSFREDLYYRLSVFPMEIPSLRQRIEDLPMLINDLISRLSNEKGHAIRFSHDALRCLSAYSWPGNVRELANLIERVLILYPGGTVDARDLPERYRKGSAWQADEMDEEAGPPTFLLPSGSLPSEGFDLKEYLEQLEYRIIQKALRESGGVVAQAAKQLKLGRTTLVEKMRKFGLSRQDIASNI